VTRLYLDSTASMLSNSDAQLGAVVTPPAKPSPLRENFLHTAPPAKKEFGCGSLQAMLVMSTPVCV
jgi:hypothetical protein